MKIGHTSNLGNRLSGLSLPRSAVALTLAGGLPWSRSCTRLSPSTVRAANPSGSAWSRPCRTTSRRRSPNSRQHSSPTAAKVTRSLPTSTLSPKKSSPPNGPTTAEDDLLVQAEEIVREVGHASVTLLQRRLGVGYTRAGRLIDKMEAAGMIGPHQGSRPRPLLAPESTAGPEQVGTA
ncbi:DNA translocase FtsK [Streptomyces sp. INA 01156]